MTYKQKPDRMSTFRNEMARSGRIVYRVEGKSMQPVLREGRDVVVIEPAGRALREYDVVLYRSGKGHYVLHRIVGKDKNGYILRGDHNTWCEYGIREDQILGIMTEIIRKDRRIRTSDWPYRLYSVCRTGLYLPRKLLRRTAAAAERIKRKCSKLLRE